MDILKDNLRIINDFPKEGVKFIDILPLLRLEECQIELEKRLLDRVKNANVKFDYIVAPEARGWLMASSIVTKKHIPFVPIRKTNKMPTGTFVRIAYDTEYSHDFLDLPNDIDWNGKHILFVDDVLATGGTYKAIKEYLEALGATINSLFLINIKDLNDLEVDALIEMNSKGDEENG